MDDLRITIRLPADIAGWLRSAKEASLRSLNSEIVFALRERMRAAGTSPEKANPAAETHTAVSAAGSSTHG